MGCEFSKTTPRLLQRQHLPQFFFALSELSPLSSHCYKLFVVAKTINSLVFKQFQTLAAKYQGWGMPLPRFNPTAKDKTMSAKSPSSTVSAARCQHRTAAGRQCRSLASDSSSELCPHHAVAEKAVNFREALTRQAAEFQNAQGVNHSLAALYDLLAEGRISARRASVLAHISSLLLRTLPAIDYDNERFPETGGLDSPQKVSPAADQSSPEPTPQRTVTPGKEPLPDTAEEFATAALNRKPN
jgi:hypothetical protein